METGSRRLVRRVSRQNLLILISIPNRLATLPGAKTETAQALLKRALVSNWANLGPPLIENKVVLVLPLSEAHQDLLSNKIKILWTSISPQITARPLRIQRTRWTSSRWPSIKRWRSRLRSNWVLSHKIESSRSAPTIPSPTFSSTICNTLTRAHQRRPWERNLRWPNSANAMSLRKASLKNWSLTMGTDRHRKRVNSLMTLLRLGKKKTLVCGKTNSFTLCLRTFRML